MSSPTAMCGKITCSMRNRRCGYRSRHWPKCRLRLSKRWAKSLVSPVLELKRIRRTGTVASVDNRNWEIGDPAIIRRLSQSRAIALDMEWAAIAANGFRFRVPYGTLLCVSDKPLHGEIKLAGMADEFYRQRIGQRLEIGLIALEKLKAQEWERLHSRKLRASPKLPSNSLIGSSPNLA
jgi:Phosphorylase superfamily